MPYSLNDVLKYKVRKDTVLSKVQDISGRAFGRLRAIEPIERRSSDDGIIWKCLCAPELDGCGNTHFVVATELKRGSVKSCGCIQNQISNIKGQVFGRLRAIEKTSQRQNGSIVWKCLCDPKLGGCGKVCFVQSNNLKSGRTKSCGCIRSEMARTARYKHKIPSLKSVK